MPKLIWIRRWRSRNLQFKVIIRLFINKMLAYTISPTKIFSKGLSGCLEWKISFSKRKPKLVFEKTCFLKRSLILQTPNSFFSSASFVPKTCSKMKSVNCQCGTLLETLINKSSLKRFSSSFCKNANPRAKHRRSCW